MATDMFTKIHAADGKAQDSKPKKGIDVLSSPLLVWLLPKILEECLVQLRLSGSGPVAVRLMVRIAG